MGAVLCDSGIDSLLCTHLLALIELAHTLRLSTVHSAGCELRNKGIL